MIDRARESRNPKKVIRVTLMESYGEIGRVPVNLYQMDAEAESVRFLPTADLSGCWLPNISLPPLLVHLMNYRFCDNNLIIIFACCQEDPPVVFCTCGALWIIADGMPFH